MLPIKKIYIDSQYKTPGSESDSNFNINLPQSLTFPDNTVFYIDDVSIPHSWYVIEEGVNDRLFIHTVDINTPLNQLYSVIPIEKGNYFNGVEFANEINSKINLVVNLQNHPNIYTVTFNVRTNTLKIQSNYSNIKFRVLTPKELITYHNQYLQSYDINNPQDINELLGNNMDYSPFYSQTTPYESKQITFQTIRNIYIHSNIGNFNTIGPRHESSIVKKVPVTSNKGDYIFNQVLTANDYGDCSKQTLRTLHFELKDSKGKLIPLHGCNFSFSIIFSRMESSL